MKYNCLIIDDEQPARKLIENYCSKVSYLKLIKSCKSALDGLHVLNNHSIDIIFLDIQMPDLNGLTFLETIRQKNINVILTTAYREYALEGFNLNAVDYLLKPIGFPRFLQAIEKVNIKPNSHPTESIVSPFIYLKADKKQYKIKVEDIQMIKSENEYVKYFFTDNTTLLVYGSLKNVETEFIEFPCFCRIHRSYIINMNAIQYIEGNSISLQGKFIPISESYKDCFLEKWKTE